MRIAKTLDMDRFQQLLICVFEAAMASCGGVIDRGGDAGPDDDDAPGAALDSGPACVAPSTSSGCSWSYTVSCNQPVSSMWMMGAACMRYCPISVCGVMPSELWCHGVQDGVDQTHVVCSNMADSGGGGSGGRRPEGLRMVSVRTTNPAGDWLANAAALEAASVPAFRRMARELSTFGAPARLIRGARRAAGDEARHARIVRALVRKNGAKPIAVAFDRFRKRTLEEIAIENAREGCVFEAYGALVTRHQASVARDESVRRAYARISIDELRHASLALATHAWAMSQLDETKRMRVERARRDALVELEGRVAARHPASTALGLPSADLARALVRGLIAAV